MGQRIRGAAGHRRIGYPSGEQWGGHHNGRDGTGRRAFPSDSGTAPFNDHLQPVVVEEQIQMIDHSLSLGWVLNVVSGIGNLLH